MATRRPKVPRAQFADGMKAPEPGAEHAADACDRHDTHDAGTPAGIPASHRAAPITGATPSDKTAGTDGGVAKTPVQQRVSRAQAARELLSPTNFRRRGWRRTGRTAGGTRPIDADSGPELTPIPAKAFSGRMLALVVVLLTITVLLAPSVRTFLQQRAQISALQQDIKSKAQQQAGLKNELSRWDDPAYIKAQARDRVNMMMPGETGYWVYGADGTTAAPSTGANAPADKVKPADLPWVDGLLQSIKRSATQ